MPSSIQNHISPTRRLACFASTHTFAYVDTGSSSTSSCFTRFIISVDTVSMYTAMPQRIVNFLMASSLYHPDTVERSLKHDGSGDEPGLKDPDGNWDLRPHRKRIIDVTDETLRIWHAVMEDESVPVRQTRMVYTVNSSAAEVLATLSHQPRAGALDLQFSRGWDESRDRKKGYFESRWGVPQSWDDVILQGPHLYVATPMYKSPNPTMKNNQDWSATDFEALATDAIPATAYKPAGEPRSVRRMTTHTGSLGPLGTTTVSRGEQWQQIPASAH